MIIPFNRRVFEVIDQLIKTEETELLVSEIEIESNNVFVPDELMVTLEKLNTLRIIILEAKASLIENQSCQTTQETLGNYRSRQSSNACTEAVST